MAYEYMYDSAGPSHVYSAQTEYPNTRIRR